MGYKLVHPIIDWPLYTPRWASALALHVVIHTNAENYRGKAQQSKHLSRRDI